VMDVDAILDELRPPVAPFVLSLEGKANIPLGHKGPLPTHPITTLVERRCIPSLGTIHPGPKSQILYARKVPFKTKLAIVEYFLERAAIGIAHSFGAYLVVACATRKPSLRLPPLVLVNMPLDHEMISEIGRSGGFYPGMDETRRLLFQNIVPTLAKNTTFLFARDDVSPPSLRIRLREEGYNLMETETGGHSFATPAALAVLDHEIGSLVSRLDTVAAPASGTLTAGR
jgi:hypothetical protein